MFGITWSIRGCLLRALALILGFILLISLFGCARMALVDRSVTNEYTGSNQMITATSTPMKSMVETLKENALTFSLGGLILLMGYAYLKQRAASKGLIAGVAEFKRNAEPGVVDNLLSTLRANTTAAQRNLIKSFRTKQDKENA